LLQVM